MQRAIKMGLFALGALVVLGGGFVTYRSWSAYRQGLRLLQAHQWTAAHRAFVAADQFGEYPRAAARWQHVRSQAAYQQGLKLLQAHQWTAALRTLTTANQFGEYPQAMARWHQAVRQFGLQEAQKAQSAWNQMQWQQAVAAVRQISSSAASALSQVGWMVQANPQAVDPRTFLAPNVVIQKTVDVLLSPKIPAIVVEGVQSSSGSNKDIEMILSWDPQKNQYRIGYQLTETTPFSFRFLPPAVANLFGNGNRALVINDIHGEGGYSAGWVFQADPSTGAISLMLHLPEGEGPISPSGHSLLAQGPSDSNGFIPTVRYTWDGQKLVGQTVTLHPPIPPHSVIVHYTVYPNEANAKGFGPKVTLSASSVTLSVGQYLVLQPSNSESAQQPLQVYELNCHGAHCNSSVKSRLIGGLNFLSETKFRAAIPGTTSILGVGIGPQGQGLPEDTTPLPVTVH